MNPLEYRKTLFTIATIAYISRTVYRFLEWRKNKLKVEQINEVITFYETAESVPSQYSVFRSKVSPSTERLLHYLNKARYSLDICMYILANREISYLIQKLHYKGVKIRLIVDADCAYEKKSEPMRLYKLGAVSLRCKRSENIMHHKFCIIDALANIQNKQVVPYIMMGSLNWTNSIYNNWESVVVMSEPTIVQLYKMEFEKLWQQLASPQHFSR